MVKSCLQLYSRHAYQKTLSLPKTKFPNRSNLQKTVDQLIPQSSQALYDEQLRSFLQQARALNLSDRADFVRDKLFVLHDGPPYANGDLHLGHALNKILKDIINRFQMLQGKYVYYKSGWDCHGLPIELKALQKLQHGPDKLSALKVRSLAAHHAQKTIKSQKNQFHKFAIATDWEDHYETMHRSFELDQLSNLKDMVKNGLIKRQNKPVYWGTETRTALAESELEYNESHESTSVYVKFPLNIESSMLLKDRLGQTQMSSKTQIKVVIWTTTPWTIFANKAVCFHKDLVYGVYESNSEYLLIQPDLKHKVFPDNSARLVCEIRGSDLAGLAYEHPLTGESNPFLHGDHVSCAAGTGFVHTAPGHGFDDYLIGINNDLEIFSPVDNEGRYKLDMLPDYLHEHLREQETGMARKVLCRETTDEVLKLLKKFQMFVSSETYVHSYPYDWRSKRPVIIRATPQWFADLTEVKGIALKSLENVKFHPERGYTRLSSFIKSRNEWCISRQRSWGVPIPAFHSIKNPDEAVMTEEIIDHVICVIKRKGIDAWFKDDNSDVSEWLPPKYQATAHLYRRGKDTVDVWFDSGSSWKVLMHFYNKELGLEHLPSPLADLYLEGSDQHRGWFQSSLLTKIATNGEVEAPYKSVITHGFTLDEEGIKMSKSIGNTIAPESVIAGDEAKGIPALGVDGLRLLIAQADFTTDIAIGSTVTKHVAESLKKLRLMLKFILGNLQKSETNYKLLTFDELRPLDQYTLCKLQGLSDEVLKHYRSNNFSKGLTAVLYHMNNHLSAFYFDIVKDSLYADPAPSLKKQQIQTTLFHIFDVYRSILAPIVPIMIQEAWNYLPKAWWQKSDDNLDASPLLRLWTSLEIPGSTSIVKHFEENELEILRLYNELFKQLTSVNKTIQTQATIFLPEDAELRVSRESLEDLLQVGRLVIERMPDNYDGFNKLVNGQKVGLLVEASEMFECPRCWRANSKEANSLCSRCYETVM
ncbi:LADA_0D05842g1_1 [Lachancea dasiensis]|uniref:isoleucine--tRNA ligase n=1 Tax=Lachancea dasiensis TaxID=1072105 RepID=A0A1G4J5P9_9SACH|nr:LADA_0D05842g1_1 [Lachancea dasiensis]